MFGLRTPELVVILLVLVVLFGASRLPGLGSALGGALRGFKRALDGREEPRGDPAPERPRPAL
ncbi:MAG TPA: twin-arginine translocase TatA/TatE family subunit [Anaeromyxobacter sp.]|nr:twin-arginine translocase TatA/TatE family subunit [Anaeromyxobacter sp.]